MVAQTDRWAFLVLTAILKNIAGSFFEKRAHLLTCSPHRKSVGHLIKTPDPFLPPVEQGSEPLKNIKSFLQPVFNTGVTCLALVGSLMVPVSVHKSQ